MYLWTEAKTNLKPDLNIKVAWNTSDKELGGEMKSACENFKSLL